MLAAIVFRLGTVPLTGASENHQVVVIAEGDVSRRSPALAPLSRERFLMVKALLVKFDNPIEWRLFVTVVGAGTI